MLISVVIPTHRRPQGLKDLLRSLADQAFAREAFEIHVVSNFREDPSREIVDRFNSVFQNIFWHYVGEKGVNRARNLGLRKSRGEIVAMFDDDCVVPHRYFLSDILSAHSEHPGATAIGGSYFVPPGASAAEIAYNQISDIWLKRRTDSGEKCVNLVGGNVSYKRAHMTERGFEFKESIVFGGAETDLHLRMFKAGAELVFLENLRIEHRARVSGLQLLKKGYKQGRSSHSRWSTGLHVQTIIPPGTAIPTLEFWPRFWKENFDRAFSLGSEQARVKSPLRRLALGARHLANGVNAYFKKAMFRWNFGKLERRQVASLPLQRFYVLPVSERCEYSCGYCESLGCKRVPKDSVADELKKAKLYGFREILLPCNAMFTRGIESIVQKIKDAGLEPTLLLNGDTNAQIDLVKLGRFPIPIGFHLLLGVASDYQSRILTFLEKQKREFTATYFHSDRISGFKILKDLPSSLANRVHFLFPTRGSAWNPKPSSVEIHKFLSFVRHKVSARYLLHVRGPAGYWPVQRAHEHYSSVYPLLDCRWSTGPVSREVEYSVIIPTFDNGPQLVKVLRSLRAQTLSPNRFEVLVMDDGSRDGTFELLKAEGETPFHLRYYYWPRDPSRVLPEFRAGLIRNLGVSQSRGEFLCFLDSDILTPPDYLEDLERRFDRHDVIQPRRDLLTRAASLAATAFKKFEGAEVYPDDSYWESFKSLDCWQQTPVFWKYTCTYALSMRKDLFMKAGWFSPEFFSYGFEDVDLGYRLYKLGARFHLSLNTVFHLYPEREVHNFHFAAQERASALTLSSRVFFRNRLDPEIFNEFYPGYYQPLYVKLLKPYYFARYQYQKRVLGLIPSSKAQPKLKAVPVES